MASNDGIVAVIGAAIIQAVSDKDSKQECEEDNGNHKLGDCASRVVGGLMDYVNTLNDPVTGDDLVEEFLRLADGS